jgi:hypothetical protein
MVDVIQATLSLAQARLIAGLCRDRELVLQGLLEDDDSLRQGPYGRELDELIRISQALQMSPPDRDM